MASASEGAVATERQQVESYLQQHDLEAKLNEIINEVVKEKPENPFLDMAQRLEEAQGAQDEILNVEAVQTLNGKGFDTIEVRVTTSKGVFVSQVAKTIPLCRDGRKNCPESAWCDDQDIDEEIMNVNDFLGPELRGMNPCDQKQIDEVMMKQALSEKLKKDSVLAVSQAVCMAGAKHKDKELFEHIADLAGEKAPYTIPLPVVTVMNGGSAANNELFVQDIMIAPQKCEDFEKALKLAAKVTNTLEKVLQEKEAVGHTNIGSHAGFSVQVETVDEALDLLGEAVKQAGEEQRILTMLDVAAEQFATVPEGGGEEGGGGEDAAVVDCKYDLTKWGTGASGALMDTEMLVETYQGLLAKYPTLCSFEDPFAPSDLAGWKQLFQIAEDLEIDDADGEGSPEAEDGGDGGEAATEGGEGGGDENAVGVKRKCVGGDKNCRLQIVSDLLVQTNEDIAKAVTDESCNGLLIDPAQMATITDTISIAKEARKRGWGVVVGNRGAETTDEFIADLSVGLNAKQIKCGGLRSAENIAKYNRLSVISGMLKGTIEGTDLLESVYAGDDFRQEI